MGASSSGSAAATVYIEDVFSTQLYTGSGFAQSISNGINLTTKGGMIWLKDRSAGTDASVYDSERGVSRVLYPSATTGESFTAGTGVTTFGASGFSLGNPQGSENTSTRPFVSWTFAQQSNFFDIVTWTSDGTTTQEIPHSLGVTPALIIVKGRSDSAWGVNYLRGNIDPGKVVGFSLNSTGGSNSTTTDIATAVTSSAIKPHYLANHITDTGAYATNSATYVAYLFADNSDLISCNYYTGNGSTAGPTVTLGWEPQFLLIKRTDTTGAWNIIDNIRGFVSLQNDTSVQIGVNASESNLSTIVSPLSTGFKLNTTDIAYNANGGTYMYIAIRRGPMKTPTSGSQVFNAITYTGTNSDNQLINTSLLTDMIILKRRGASTYPVRIGSRILGNRYMATTAIGSTIDADSFSYLLSNATEWGNAFSDHSGVFIGNDATFDVNVSTNQLHIALAFKRAPGVFDAVAYEHPGGGYVGFSHNLGVIPELAIQVKADGAAADFINYWLVRTTLTTNGEYGGLHTNAWNSSGYSRTIWSSTQFDHYQGTAGNLYIAFLFATLAGVSKVGTYIGTGASQTVNAGLASSPRFIMIKRIDPSQGGDWYIFDSARGVSAGADPYITTNTNAAEVSATDMLVVTSSGFTTQSTGVSLIGVSGAKYLYLAIS